MEIVKVVGYDFLKSVAGVAVARQLNLADKLDFGNNFFMVHGANGIIYFLISDAINYLSLNKSKLFSGDLKGIVDDSTFFGAVSAGSRSIELDKQIYAMMNMGLKDRTSLEIAVDSAILTGARVLGSYVDGSAAAPTILKAIRHPTALLGM